MIARGYLIDPINKKILHCRHDTKDHKEIYRLIECGNSPFTIVYLDESNVIFVDDEGLLKDPRYFFNWDGYEQPLAGKGLILGTNAEGKTCSTTLTYEYVTSKVTFSEHKVLDMVTEEGTTKDGAFFVKTTPVFGPPE